MANERLPMCKTKEVLRLRHVCGLREREIAESCQVARTTVGNYLRRAESAGLSWPQAAEVSEADLERRLFPRLGLSSQASRPAPDCQYIYDELRGHRKLNLMLVS